MSSKNPFNIVGISKDGLPVISGILHFEETYGLPLEMILEYLRDKGFIPSWLHILEETRNQGVNLHKFMTKLETCVVSVYGKQYWNAINPILQQESE